MDTSETYIKMSDCPEIQKEARYIGDNMEELGNWFAFYVTGKWQPPVIYTYGLCLPYERGDYAVWLPSQDDLQKMIIDHTKLNLLRIIRVFNFWFESQISEGEFNDEYSFPKFYPINFTSMEQLWLAFIMKEKYNKVWTNNEWRNGSES